MIERIQASNLPKRTKNKAIKGLDEVMTLTSYCGCTDDCQLVEAFIWYKHSYGADFWGKVEIALYGGEK